MGFRFTKRLAVWTLALFALWLLLSESFRVAHVLIGLAAAVSVAALNARLRPERRRILQWWGPLIYFPWLFWRICASGLRVCSLILHPRMPIKPRLFRHATDLDDDLAVTLLGNSITLTPGTITVESRRDELVVHAISGGPAQEAAIRQMEKKISTLFRSRGK